MNMLDLMKGYDTRVFSTQDEQIYIQCARERIDQTIAKDKNTCVCAGFDDSMHTYGSLDRRKTYFFFLCLSARAAPSDSNRPPFRLVVVGRRVEGRLTPATVVAARTPGTLATAAGRGAC